MRSLQTLFARTYPALFIAVALTSCYPYMGITDPVPESRQKENFYYAPSVQYTPLLTHQNDFNAAAQLSIGNKQKGFDMHAAYMAGKHLGLMAGYSRDRDHPQNVIITRANLGFGYVQSLPRNVYFETYAGAGGGKTTNFHYTGMSTINTAHFFIQPAISIQNKTETIQLALVSRVTGTRFTIADTTFSNYRESYVTAQMKLMNDKPLHLFLEPGIVLHAGWKNVMIVSSYSFSTDLTNKDLHMAGNNFSVGLLFRAMGGK